MSDHYGSEASQDSFVLLGQLKVTSPGDSCTYKVPVGEKHWIGRAHGCDIRIDEPWVSRWHILLFSVEGYERVPSMLYIQDKSSNSTTVTRRSPGPMQFVLKGFDEPMLLEHGDVIRICHSDTEIEFLAISGESAVRDDFSIDEIQRREVKYISPFYDILPRLIGTGGQGKVCLAVHKLERRQVACKITDLRRERVQRHAALDQAEMLRGLTHANIIGIEQVFHSDTTLYEFQELITAGDLQCYMQSRDNNIHHAEASVIARQILKATEYLHENHVIHRDLKLENILLTSLTVGARVVVTDFDMCCYEPGWAEALPGVIPRVFDNEYKGTAGYTAPEIYEAGRDPLGKPGYTRAVDLWSVGVIIATLLTGWGPFSIGFKQDQRSSSGPLAHLVNLRHKIDNNFTQTSDWSNVPETPKDLVRKLLVISETARFTATQALEHDWFTANGMGQRFDQIWAWATRYMKPRREAGSMFIREIDPEIHSDQITTVVRVPEQAQLKRSTQSRLGLSPSKRQRKQGPDSTFAIAKDSSCASTSPSVDVKNQSPGMPTFGSRYSGRLRQGHAEQQRFSGKYNDSINTRFSLIFPGADDPAPPSSPDLLFNSTGLELQTTPIESFTLAPGPSEEATGSQPMILVPDPLQQTQLTDTIVAHGSFDTRLQPRSWSMRRQMSLARIRETQPSVGIDTIPESSFPLPPMQTVQDSEATTEFASSFPSATQLTTQIPSASFLSATQIATQLPSAQSRSQDRFTHSQHREEDVRSELTVKLAAASSISTDSSPSVRTRVGIATRSRRSGDGAKPRGLFGRMGR